MEGKVGKVIILSDFQYSRENFELVVGVDHDPLLAKKALTKSLQEVNKTLLRPRQLNLDWFIDHQKKADKSETILGKIIQLKKGENLFERYESFVKEDKLQNCDPYKAIFIIAEFIHRNRSQIIERVAMGQSLPFLFFESPRLFSFIRDGITNEVSALRFGIDKIRLGPTNIRELNPKSLAQPIYLAMHNPPISEKHL